MLDANQADFRSELEGIDQLSAKTETSVHLIYQPPGLNLVQEIVEATVFYIILFFILVRDSE